MQFHDTESFDVKKEIQIPAPYDPTELIQNISDGIRQDFPEFAEFSDDKIISIATRGVVNSGRVTDPVKVLDMDDFPLAEKLSEQLDNNRVIIGNDTNVGAFGAFPTNSRGRNLYLTISTGIGAGLLIDGQSSHDLANLEIGHMKTWRNDKWVEWEELASGKVFYNKYGDGHKIPAGSPIWPDYAREVAVGILAALPTLYPDEIAIGGKMSEYFDKFGPTLQQIIAEFGWKANNYSVIISAVDNQRYIVNRGAAIFALKQPVGNE